MRFLIDAQLPPALARWLRSAGHDADHVLDLELLEASDTAIAAYAYRIGATILSKDEDFAGLAGSDRMPPVVWLRMGNSSNAALIARLAPHWDDVCARLGQGERLIEIR